MTTKVVISFVNVLYDNKCCDIVLKTCDMTTNVVISFENMLYDNKCCDIVL